MTDRGGMTVSELNLIIAEAVRKDPRVRDVTVRGEVSGFRNQISSGHWYFVLKDSESAVSCVMFRSNTLRASIRPKDGQSVLVTGYVRVYAKNGTYQLYATGIQDAGHGDLYARLEELKRRLFAEGLFDPARKKTLPMLPRKVAVVTSGSGAALQDIINVSGARCPAVPIMLVPVTVQGATAAGEIAAGIRKADQDPETDVVIVARGGGSAEDLWCFNDERIVRAVAECRKPVVSGVGHEIDTTLCDLAADVRAATPSNAAEIVFPTRTELAGRIGRLRQALYQATRETISGFTVRITECSRALAAVSPERRITGLAGRSQVLRERMNHAMMKWIAEMIMRRDGVTKRLEFAMARRNDAARTAVERVSARMKALNPLGILERGYTIVYAENGDMLTRADDARHERRMSIRFADGRIKVCPDPERTGATSQYGGGQNDGAGGRPEDGKI